MVQRTFTAEERLELLAYSDLDDNDFDSQDSEVKFVGELNFKTKTTTCWCY